MIATHIDLAEAGLGLVAVALGVLLLLKRHQLAPFADAQSRTALRAQNLLNQERLDQEASLYSSEAGRRVTAFKTATSASWSAGSSWCTGSAADLARARGRRPRRCPDHMPSPKLFAA